MGKCTILGNKLNMCDAIHVPSPTCIPAQIDPDRSPDNIPVNRRFFHCSDWALAKRVARFPEEVDARAGICVPTAPPINQIDYLGSRRSETMTLRQYLNEIDAMWQQCVANGYTYSAFLVHTKGYSMELRVSTDAPPVYAHSHVVYSNIKLDERVRMHYNTPADPGADSEANATAAALLESSGCADQPMGNTLLVRESILHNVPLGLAEISLKQMFGDRAPLANLPKRRRRTKAAAAAKKRRRRLQQSVSSEGVEPNEDEVLLIRVGTDDINPYSCVIASRPHLEEALKTLVGWQGELAEFPIKQVKNNSLELVCITANADEPAEVTHRRTGPPEMYRFNETAARAFPALPMEVLQGPVVVAMRTTSEKGGFVNLDTNSFREHVFTRPS